MIGWPRHGSLLGIAVAVAIVAAACSTSEPAAQLDPHAAATPTVVPVPTAIPQPAVSTGQPTVFARPTSPPVTAIPTPEASPTPLPTLVPVNDACTLVPAGTGERGTTALNTDVLVQGLEVPWGLAILPSGDFLVTERPGRLRLVEDGVLVDEPLLEIAVSDPDPLFGIDRLGFEGGLLDVLLHPAFESNRLFYLFVNVANTDGQDIGRLLRYRLGDDDRTVELDRVILDEIPTGLHHQGGRMHIGPDGQLYVSVGAFDPPEAQNPDTLAGKLLRLGLDGEVPPDNPTPGSYVYVSGIRNTQGFDWIDDDTIVLVDHGPSGLELDMPELRGFDEVNVVRAGDNVGWPRVWGCDAADGVVTPALTWVESVPPTGLTIYRSDAIPEWTGSALITVVGRVTAQHLQPGRVRPSIRIRSRIA